MTTTNDISDEEAVAMIDFTKLYIDPQPDPTVSQYRLDTFFTIFATCWRSWPFDTDKQPWWQSKNHTQTYAGQPRFEEGRYTLMEITEAGQEAIKNHKKLDIFESLEMFVRANGLMLSLELDEESKESVKVFIRNKKGTLPGEWGAGREILVMATGPDPR